MNQVTVIGAGHIGTMIAYFLAENQVAHVQLLDVNEGLAKGKALDLMEAAPIRGYTVRMNGSHFYQDMTGSQIVVLAAESSRSSLSDSEQMTQNTAILSNIMTQVLQFAPDAIILNLMQPVDEFTKLIIERWGLDPARVVGIAAGVQLSQLIKHIALETGLSSRDISALALGAAPHQLLFPLNYMRIRGIPVDTFLDGKTIGQILETVCSGHERVSPLFAHDHVASTLGAVVAQVASLIVHNTPGIVCLSSFLNGPYGISDVCLTTPLLLGGGGVEKIIEVHLTDEELTFLEKASETVKTTANRIINGGEV